MNAAVLHLCATCDGALSAADHAALAEALRAEGLPVTLTATSCLNACRRPVSAALQGPGRATYLFTGLDPRADAADIAATLHAYLDAPAGWIVDARPCGRLRLCLAGRVPALPDDPAGPPD